MWRGVLPFPRVGNLDGLGTAGYLSTVNWVMYRAVTFVEPLRMVKLPLAMVIIVSTGRTVSAATGLMTSPASLTAQAVKR